MQKYFLLVFNEDWADEHNVPAQACFTETQYNKWLESPMGTINPKYKEKKAIHDLLIEKKDIFHKELNDRNLYNKKYCDFTPEEVKWYEENKIDYDEYGYPPKRVKSYLSAQLGNGGEGFNEGYSNYAYGQDFVIDGTVKVHEVPKEFFEVFNDVRLYDLSLCNIFREDLATYYGDVDWEEED